jgi:hypothetical protein
MTTILIIFILALLVYIIYTVCKATGIAIPHPEDEKAPKELSRQADAGSAASEAVPEIPPGGAAATETAAEPKAAVSNVRDPKTGEITTFPNTYRFAKRWIKEALVEEGLLDRIYRNNELSAESVNEEVRDALNRFRELEKYQV